MSEAVLSVKGLRTWIETAQGPLRAVDTVDLELRAGECFALVMDFSGLVLAEAVLSYVGIGVDPTMISFGTMINSARMELGREPVVWWSLAAAFTTMFILVLAANLFADAVRDAFDPRAA